MANIFNIEPSRKVKRTRFHLNHEVKTTARFGELTPILCQEVLPGDTWKLQTEQLIRFAPVLSPVMHRCNAFLHYYFVPNRLLMRDSWEDFISPNGLPDEERPELPFLHFDGKLDSLDSYEKGFYHEVCSLVKDSRLLDHFGFAFAGSWNYAADAACWHDGRLKLPLMPIAAYWLIMQDYYLDENQNDIRNIKKALLELMKVGECSLSDFILKRPDIDYDVFALGGVDDFIDWSIVSTDMYPHVAFFCKILSLCQRAFEKDYFTSALPTTQRGADVTLGGVQRIDHAFVNTDGLKVSVNKQTSEGDIPNGDAFAVAGYKNNVDDNIKGIDNTDYTKVDDVTFTGETESTLLQVGDENGQPVEINPITINELRRAVKLQEFLEKSMRGGYRLIEQIFAHFGVISSNKLLDRCQFLGGASNPVTISEVTGTAGTDLTALGEYSGHMQSFGGSRKIKFFSEEHGWLFCFLSVLPRTNYCQGILKQFQRHDRFDYAWPEFAHLGEQPVWQNELYNGDEADQDPHETFGYQSRYSEYKYIPSQVSGDFKSSLDYWTMVRRFANKPTLSNEFIQCNPTDESNTDIFTIQDDSDYLYCQFYHKILAKRCLPKFGVPML